jgi:hypothetical protein
MSLSPYWKLIKQGMADVGINSRYGSYSLKNVAINKLFGLGLDSTMGLIHYNSTSSQLRALSLLTSMKIINTIDKCRTTK